MIFSAAGDRQILPRQTNNNLYGILFRELDYEYWLLAIVIGHLLLIKD
jgi:hypothetical protein